MLRMFGLLAGLGLMHAPGYAGNLIAVVHQGGTTYFAQDSLQQAIDFAQDGDVIYLPGGTYSRNGGYTLDKSISMIGVGYAPDSTIATGSSRITSQLQIGTAASGSFFTGMYFSTIVALPGLPIVHDALFYRCHVHSIGAGAYGNSPGDFNSSSSNIQFSECILGSVDLNSARNCAISSSIVYIDIDGVTSSIVESCIFTYLGTFSVFYGNSSSILNSIFLDPSVSISSGGTNSRNLYRNCVFVDSDIGVGVLQQNNVYGATTSTLFVNYDGDADLYMDDFHLLPGSPAAGAGVGGIDCGIHDGPSPWKAGAVPFNPHISTQNVAPTTNPQGELPVTIRVNAQDR